MNSGYLHMGRMEANRIAIYTWFIATLVTLGEFPLSGTSRYLSIVYSTNQSPYLASFLTIRHMNIIKRGYLPKRDLKFIIEVITFLTLSYLLR